METVNNRLILFVISYKKYIKELLLTLDFLHNGVEVLVIYNIIQSI